MRGAMPIQITQQGEIRNRSEKKINRTSDYTAITTALILYAHRCPSELIQGIIKVTAYIYTAFI